VNKCARFAGLAKTLSERHGLPKVNARQKDHKIVSALSPKYCGAASGRLGEVSESAVSRLVPVSIIEASKGIDIARERGDRLPRPAVLPQMPRCLVPAFSGAGWL
jgi:hypothetical protein